MVKTFAVQVHRTLDPGNLNSYLVDLDKLEKNSYYIWPHSEKGKLSRADHRASVQFFKIVFPFLLFELSN